MNIRQAEEKDMFTVVKLQQQFIEEYAQTYDTVFYALSPQAEKEWIQWAQKKIQEKSLGLFIAEKNNIIIGYVSGWVEERPPIYSLTQVGYLSNMFIIPEERKKGIGSHLHEALLQWFKEKGVAYIELSVHAQAISAHAAWIALGYKEIAKRMRRAVE